MKLTKKEFERVETVNPSGIASSVENRLFTDHNVDKKNGPWIYEPADSESVARDVEKYFVDELKTSGGTGGGQYPRFVYAYKINSHTRE